MGFFKYYIFVYLIALLGGAAAGYNEYYNDTRALRFCPDLLPPGAKDDDISIINPVTTALLIIVSISIFSKWTRLSAFIVTLLFSCFALYVLYDNSIKDFAPCDRKGDTSSEWLVTLAVFIIPIIWLCLAFVLFITDSIINAFDKTMA